MFLEEIFTNYIDPGTGGMIASSLWGYVLIALGMIAAFILSITRPVRRALGRAWAKISGR